VLQALPKPAELGGKISGHAALVVATEGERAGRPVREVRYTLLDHRVAFARYGTTATAYLTGTPAAVAALLLLDGTQRARGMLPPESLDAAPFFPKLAERGVEVVRRAMVEPSQPA